MRCATASASSCAPGSRSAATAATGRACFRSAPPPGAMRRPRACSTPTPRMRSFMKFPADKIGLYLDWRTQEVGIAAARSGDEQLAEDYLSGDIYHALAMMCGLTNDTDVKSWKATPEGKTQRQRMKALQLGINYGMGVRVAVARARPASDDRQRGHHPASAALPDVLGVARRAWCSAPCWNA